MIALIIQMLVVSALLGSDSSAAKAESLVKACKTAFNNNYLKTALDDCDKAIALDPTIASAYAFRGDIKDVSGDHHGAIADYNIALKLNPNYQYGYATRCDTKRELEDYSGAKADCTKAIGLNPGDGYSYNRFGYLDLDTGNGASAVKHFTIAIKNDPTLASSYAGRCHAYDNLEKYSQAIEDCKSALDIDPQSDDGLFYLAWAERNAGMATDAVGHWNTYIKRNPDDAVAYYNRGLANRDAGNLADAKRDFGAYVKAKPKDGDGFYERGLVEEKLDDKTAALTDMKAALKLYQIAGDDQSAKQATDEIKKLEGN